MFKELKKAYVVYVVTLKVCKVVIPPVKNAVIPPVKNAGKNVKDKWKTIKTQNERMNNIYEAIDDKTIIIKTNREEFIVPAEA